MIGIMILICSVILTFFIILKSKLDFDKKWSKQLSTFKISGTDIDIARQDIQIALKIISEEYPQLKSNLGIDLVKSESMFVKNSFDGQSINNKKIIGTIDYDSWIIFGKKMPVVRAVINDSTGMVIIHEICAHLIPSIEIGDSNPFHKTEGKMKKYYIKEMELKERLKRLINS